jgi:uncharacterized protein YcnI
MRFRRPLTVTTATLAVLVVGALPASAHPFFTDGATAPAGSLTTLTLAMAHGCGTEEDAGGDPTLEVALEVPEAFSYVEPGEAEGYEASVEGGEPGRPEVVTWTATDGGEPAPDFELDVVVEGEVGEEIHVRVFQGCDGFSYRWVGTPDDPADDPAVRLTLGEPDPDAPPPPTPEDPATPGTEEDVDGPGTATDADADGADADDADGADGDEEVPPTVEDLPTEPPEDEGADGFGWLPLLIGALVIAAIGALLGARLRRPVPDEAAGDGTGMDPPADGR